jgi:uncharacterized protein (DUF302 family)
MEYEIKTMLNEDYAVTVEKTIKALKEEEIGVITEIHMKNTLKKKLTMDFERYMILGACNPTPAKRAHLGLIKIRIGKEKKPNFQELKVLLSVW